MLLKTLVTEWMRYNRKVSKYYKRQIIPSGKKKQTKKTNKKTPGVSGDSGEEIFYLNKWDDKKWGNGIFHQRKEVLILKSLNNRCDKLCLKKIFQLCNKNIFPKLKNIFKKSGWFQTSKNEHSELWLIQKEYLYKVL